ncbi:MAG: hypothetical protein WAN38_13170, partial [Terriglobales bacterium]
RFLHFQLRQDTGDSQLQYLGLPGFLKRERNGVFDSEESLPDSQGVGFGETRGEFFYPSERIHGILWSLCGTPWHSKAEAFSYNKRTMDRAMGPF